MKKERDSVIRDLILIVLYHYLHSILAYIVFLKSSSFTLVYFTEHSGKTSRDWEVKLSNYIFYVTIHFAGEY